MKKITNFSPETAQTDVNRSHHEHPSRHCSGGTDLLLSQHYWAAHWCRPSRIMPFVTHHALLCWQGHNFTSLSTCCTHKGGLKGVISMQQISPHAFVFLMSIPQTYANRYWSMPVLSPVIIAFIPKWQVAVYLNGKSQATNHLTRI